MNDEKHKEGRFLALTTSVHLPSNLLADFQPRLTNRFPQKADTADPYKHSATIDLTTQSNFHAFTADRQTRYRKRKQQSREVVRKWIVEKQQQNDKQQSLSKRLKNMRIQNDVLESFSLSKLLSKIRVLKESQQRYTDYTFSSPPKQKPKKAVKPQLFKFRQQSTSPPKTSTSVQISPRPHEQAEDSSKIFKRFYCPPSSYRDPSFFKEIEPDDKYIYKDGKKVQCKRIHNFYTSHMYRRGYSRHYRKIEQEELDDLLKSAQSKRIK